MKGTNSPTLYDGFMAIPEPYRSIIISNMITDKFEFYRRHTYHVLAHMFNTSDSQHINKMNAASILPMLIATVDLTNNTAVKNPSYGDGEPLFQVKDFQPPTIETIAAYALLLSFHWSSFHTCPRIDESIREQAVVYIRDHQCYPDNQLTTEWDILCVALKSGIMPLDLSYRNHGATI